MQRPSDLGGGCASPTATSLILTRMRGCGTTAGPFAVRLSLPFVPFAPFRGYSDFS
jgi:hypothetical protein